MKIRPLPLLVSAFALGAALFMGCRSEPPVPMGWYVATETVDLSAFLREPPTNSSPTTRAELDAMLALQQARTPEDLQRIRGDGPVGLRMFAGALGPNVRPEQLPATAALLSFAMDNAQAVINDAKARWQRPRPWALESRLSPCIDKPSSPSYPSDRATQSRLCATLLGALVTSRQAALLTRADQVAQDRVLAGVHFPSDVQAGKELGQFLAERMLLSPASQADLATARAELAKQVP